MADSRGAVPLVKNADTHVIAGLLKVYLRELPEALFTDTLYPKLVEGFGEYQPSAVLRNWWIMPVPDLHSLPYIYVGETSGYYVTS